MKKPFLKIFRRDLIGPIVHMAFVRALLGVTAALLWNEFVNVDAALSMRAYAFLFLGVFLLAMGWMAYLRLSGLRMPTFDKRLFEWKKRPKRIKGDMIDFVDEEVAGFDDLEDDERDLCRLIANVLCGAAFLALSLI